MKHILFLACPVITMASAQTPAEQASEARLWLKVPAGNPPITPVSVEHGSALQAPWENNPEIRSRQTDIHFPIQWWRWTGQTIRFTPKTDGQVELWLMGPWAQEKNGSPPRKEVLWDSITAVGADLTNGGFEEIADGRPLGWQSPWAAYPAETEWPLAQAAAMDGKRAAAAWIQRPLVQTLQLRAGHPVTIHLHAKAATPPDFITPKRLGQNSRAHQAIKGLRRGVNLGNAWEAKPGTWGLKFTSGDIDHIADEGFDHIRVPVAWHFHSLEANGSISLDPAFLAELEPVLRRAIDRKLHIILNWHHFHDFTRNPGQNLQRFNATWQSIASHFKNWPPALCFELLNEPCDALTTTALGPIYQKTIRLIRETNPQRILFVSPAHWGIISELDGLRLPDDDDHIIVTVHCYEPFHFTHQGAGWVGLDTLRGVRYPGPPESPLPLPDSLRDHQGVMAFLESYNHQPASQNPCSPATIRRLLDTAHQWSHHFGRPVHLGEFGAHQTADLESRARYLRDVRTLAEQRGIPWTLWEWKAGFGYWDTSTQQPIFRKSLIE
jgi:endoglucanase